MENSGNGRFGTGPETAVREKGRRGGMGPDRDGRYRHGRFWAHGDAGADLGEKGGRESSDMGEGMLDINGDAAACRCGGDVERTMGRVPIGEPGGSRRMALVYEFRCTGCGRVGYQGLFSFMEGNPAGDLPGSRSR
jgi:hypothetical protein